MIERLKSHLPIALRLSGFGLLLVGLVAAYYGPLEIYVFYFFSDGGRFSYEGFGMGSLWFAALVVQNLGYYLTAALLIPVGVGHIRLRRWALTLTRLYAWFWLGAGLLLAANLAGLIPPALDLDLPQDVVVQRLVVAGLVSLTGLVLLPALVLWFYGTEAVETAFDQHDQSRYWTERYPFSLLALLFLFGIMILVLHLAIFFQALFPWFGRLMLGRQPVYLISFCIVVLGVLIYGTARLRAWAWWVSLVFVSLLAISTGMSFAGHSFAEIVQLMDLPGYERQFLAELRLLHDFQPVGLLVPPLLACLGLLLYSRRYFTRR